MEDNRLSWFKFLRPVQQGRQISLKRASADLLPFDKPHVIASNRKIECSLQYASSIADVEILKDELRRVLFKRLHYRLDVRSLLQVNKLLRKKDRKSTRLNSSH